MNRLTYKEKWFDEFDNEHQYKTKDNYCIEKLGKLEDLEEQLGCPLEAIAFIFNIIDRTGFLPSLIESSQSIYTEEGEYFMTEKEYKVFKEHYPKRMIYKNYGAIDEKLSIPLKYKYILSIIEPDKKYTFRDLSGLTWNCWSKDKIYRFRLHQATLTSMVLKGLLKKEEKNKIMYYWKEE